MSHRADVAWRDERWRRWRIALLGGVLLVLAAEPALAFRYGQCFGVPTTWNRDTIPLQIMTCSAPPRSHRAGDLLAGVERWNAVPGTTGRFSAEFGPPTCRIRINRRSELGYVRPETLDGARAVTRVAYDQICNAAPLPGQTIRLPHIIEADMVVADFAHDATGPATDCNTLRRNAPWRRALVMHELGHVFGLKHENDTMAVMNQSASGGRYCGERAFDPHPDDRRGVRFLYRQRNPEEVRDVGAIAFHLASPNFTEPVAYPGDIALCPGERVELRYSVANQGTVDAVTSVRWYLSENDMISRHDIPAGTTEPFRVPVGGFVTDLADLVMPDDVPLDTRYRVGFMVDPDGSGWEFPISNDVTYTEASVLRRPPEQCD